MKKTNSQMTKLYLALQPNQSEDSNKQFELICDATSCNLNVNQEKVETSYFCNDGAKTSLIVNTSFSISVSIDYDPTNEAHKYLHNIFIQGAQNCNNQFIQLRMNLKTDNSYDSLSGKTCIHFKSFPPSGGANELAKIEFDLFPQDRNWVWGTGNE